ncbi:MULTISPECIES: NVEALA domain-containing protein [Bacteroides]|jgi:mevalonate kinase|uniref:NVEALA domain-containing protein n=1 Tax=Bacteroides TaxID=816 RepID=UPI000E482569|nr:MULTISPECIES: NVEALA domain-containing protein [Bacteroides]RHL12963.1 hypothetical protein DW036_02595 [Bacteroides sp. AF39-11AC]
MKNFLKYAFVAAFVTVAGYSVYSSQKSDAMSNLMLANVEALAGGEGSGSDIYCCGNSGVCMVVIDNTGTKHDVKGVKSTLPCP